MNPFPCLFLPSAREFANGGYEAMRGIDQQSEGSPRRFLNVIAGIALAFHDVSHGGRCRS